MHEVFGPKVVWVDLVVPTLTPVETEVALDGSESLEFKSMS
jgi:hypothetical protein